MAWYSRLFTAHDEDAGLTADQQQAVAAWHELPAADLKRSHYRTRYVVVDVETTACGARADRLLSLGALAVTDGMIDFSDALEVHLAEPLADTEYTTITEAQTSACLMPPSDALIAFLHFAGKAPLIAFHASLVSRVVEGALAEHLGFALRQPWIDLAWVMSDLFRDGPGDAATSLDKWLAHFDIESIQRHHVVSDAYVAAKLVQMTIARAARKGFVSPAGLLELEKARRHLHQSG